MSGEVLSAAQDNRENLPKQAGVSGTELEETLWLLNRVIHAAETSIVVSDPSLPDNPLIYHNPAFERISGYSRNEIYGHNCRFLQGPESDSETVAEIRRALKEGRSCDVTLLNYRKDGSTFWNHLVISPVHGNDGAITHFVGVQNDVTTRREAEQERDLLLAHQQRIADTLQRALLLAAPETFHGLEINTQYESAWDEAQVGGDFFDTFALDQNTVALVVGDCTGKGLDAAQHTAEIKYALRVLLREYANPIPALSRLNRFLIEAQRLDGRDADALVCVTLVILNTQTGAAAVTSAGMEPPLVLRADGSAEELEVTGIMIGFDADAQYQELRLTLQPGDTLLMASDGIVEARNSRRKFFGYEGFREAALQTASLPSVQAMGEEIVARVKAFAGGKTQDDVCLLIARRPTAGISEVSERSA